MRKAASPTQSARFPIIKAICRSIMDEPSEAQLHQVKRLADDYEATGESTEAKALRDILESGAGKATGFAPSRLVRSKANLGGEVLTSKTPAPVDKETAVPLAQVLFPSTAAVSRPTFDPRLKSAVDSLVEEWAHWDELTRAGVDPARSCLIYGPPGTGKTTLALWMARELQLPLVVARLDGMISSFLGTTSRNIGTLFNFANRYRCVLLLDEFDAVAKVRDDPHEVGEIKRVVNTLLQNLDSRRDFGITVGITNHEQLLDAAVWRRFDAQIHIPRPEFATRTEIAARFLGKDFAAPFHGKLLAWISDGLAGSEIESLARSIRKAKVIDGPQFDLLETMRRLSALNSGRVSAERVSQLALENPRLAAALKADPSLGLDTNELAELFGNHPSTIGRWINST